MKKAVLLMGCFSIASIDEPPAFYSHLFHGRLPAESVPGRWATAAAGPLRQTWLAPDVTGMIVEAAADGAAAVVVCDLLTVTENVEVVYDCGHDCSVKARELGMEFVSVQYPNDSDDFMTALERIVAGFIDASEVQG